MPVSLTTLGRPDARDGAPDVLPSTVGNASASQKYVVFEAQWLAYALPCRRFTPALADDGARLGADVVRYSFIVVDLHHLLLAGLPAHTHPTSYCALRADPVCCFAEMAANFLVQGFMLPCCAIAFNDFCGT